jgi:hypothetical protein
MSLHPLELVDWIEVDTELPTYLAEKRQLLHNRWRERDFY